MLPIQGMAPLLQVYDMPASIHFYCDQLGFRLKATSSPADFGWALLEMNGIEIMLNTAYDEGERPAVPDPVRQSAHGDTILFFNCTDVDALRTLLISRGVIAQDPVIRPYGMKQLVVSDPDGYGVCFQSPVRASSPEIP